MSDTEGRVSAMKAGIAAIMGCMVETMEEMQPGSRERFIHKIGQACANLRESEQGNHVDAVELVIWTGELVSGWNNAWRKGGPFIT